MTATSEKCKKGKVFLLHAMKAYRGSRGIALLSLNRSTRWRWLVGLCPRLLSSAGKNPRYPLNGRLYGLQSQSLTFWRSIPCICRDLKSGSSSPQFSQRTAYAFPAHTVLRSVGSVNCGFKRDLRFMSCDHSFCDWCC
jgi:hypothetical protein